jgi:adhesin transport system membrane fusion protein
MSKQKGSKIRVSEIIPGMVVTADILTGHRSVLHYLLKPVYNAFDGALSQK